jgi:hypothetical protein
MQDREGQGQMLSGTRLNATANSWVSSDRHDWLQKEYGCLGKTLSSATGRWYVYPLETNRLGLAVYYAYGPG